ncbi:MAG TPA: hypothetical protein VLT88_08260, partial [Desulfosarcina sp.]|nr:hypothetical protein [Desulfosarcina sp.]
SSLPDFLRAIAGETRFEQFFRYVLSLRGLRCTFASLIVVCYRFCMPFKKITGFAFCGKAAADDANLP